MTPFVQGISSPIMENIATGERLSSRDLPIGALWAMNNEEGWYQAGADGLAICCILPDRNHWFIDSVCSNCPSPADKAHRCWVRHGTIGGLLTVDKAGKTCAAGAGSIKTDRYHGFLRNGRLVRS